MTDMPEKIRLTVSVYVIILHSMSGYSGISYCCFSGNKRCKYCAPCCPHFITYLRFLMSENIHTSLAITNSRIILSAAHPANVAAITQRDFLSTVINSCDMKQQNIKALTNHATALNEKESLLHACSRLTQRTGRVRRCMPAEYRKHHDRLQSIQAAYSFHSVHFKY